MPIRDTDTMPFTHRVSGELETVCDGARPPRQADNVVCRHHAETVGNLIPNFKRRFSLTGEFFSRHHAGMSDWSKRLNDRRKHLGWSQAELARRSQVSEDSVRKYCQGGVDQPRGSTIDALADALGVDRLWLRDGVSPDDAPKNEQERVWLEMFRKLSPEARKALMAAGNSLTQPLDDGNGDSGGTSEKAS